MRTWISLYDNYGMSLESLIYFNNALKKNSSLRFYSELRLENNRMYELKTCISICQWLLWNKDQHFVTKQRRQEHSVGDIYILAIHNLKAALYIISIIYSQHCTVILTYVWHLINFQGNTFVYQSKALEFVVPITELLVC